MHFECRLRRLRPQVGFGIEMVASRVGRDLKEDHAARSQRPASASSETYAESAQSLSAVSYNSRKENHPFGKAHGRATCYTIDP
jgi:hypothetical protein